jgi:hypothetical protein
MANEQVAVALAPAQDAQALRKAYDEVVDMVREAELFAKSTLCTFEECRPTRQMLIAKVWFFANASLTQPDSRCRASARTTRSRCLR